MNEFSILCRVLGTLYYRQPQDPLLVPLFTLIREGKLAENWPLEQITMRCSSAMSAAFRHTVLPGRKGRRKRKSVLSSPRAVCR